MKIGSYNFNMSLILDEIKKHGYKTVLLQAPEGVKKYVFQVVDEIETKTKAKVMISTDPCYGACDIPVHAAKQLGVDLVVQLGHLPIPNLKLPLPVLFMNIVADAREEESVKKAIEKLEGTKIGVVTTAQHIEKLPQVVGVLKKNGFIPVVGKGDNRIARDGQVLGCNMSTAQSISDKVDCFLFVGTGRFHPLGIALATSKPVVSANPFTLEVLKSEINEEKKKLMKKRYGAIAAAYNAKTFGIVVSVKPGQMRMKTARVLEKKLENAGKKVYILIADDINPSLAKTFDVDCLVSTACPRVVLDEAERFEIPLLTPTEVDILLEETNKYKLDTLQ